jgi:hypothetical protein
MPTHFATSAGMVWLIIPVISVILSIIRTVTGEYGECGRFVPTAAVLGTIHSSATQWRFKVRRTMQLPKLTLSISPTRFVPTDRYEDAMNMNVGPEISSDNLPSQFPQAEWSALLANDW